MLQDHCSKIRPARWASSSVTRWSRAPGCGCLADYAPWSSRLQAAQADPQVFLNTSASRQPVEQLRQYLAMAQELRERNRPLLDQLITACVMAQRRSRAHLADTGYKAGPTGTVELIRRPDRCGSAPPKR